MTNNTNQKTEPTYSLDLTSLFNAVGINERGEVLITEHTHDFEPTAPKNHWLYAALLGFKKYHANNKFVNSFTTIGTGSGIDAIGAYEILRPKKFILTDIHPAIPPVAKINVTNHVAKDVEVKAYRGDLCQPLIDNNIKTDLIYANIPNIPSVEPAAAKKCVILPLVCFQISGPVLK